MTNTFSHVVNRLVIDTSDTFEDTLVRDSNH